MSFDPYEEDWTQFAGWMRDDLIVEVLKLRYQLKQANKRIVADSWIINSDRMGGQFAPSEIEQQRRGEQGIFG